MHAPSKKYVMDLSDGTATIVAITVLAFVLTNTPSRADHLQTHERFTSTVTGRGKLRSDLYGFRLTDNPTCPCEKAEDQTTEHLIRGLEF